MAPSAKMARHVQLLIALVATEMLSPLIAQATQAARIISISLFCVICIAVIRAVFDTKRQQWIGIFLACTAVAIDFARLLLPGLRPPMDILLTVCAAMFFVFVLSVIVSQLFGKRRLRSDDIVGALSGYILIALFWGRLYALLWLLMPASFNINADVRWQLHDWNTLHSLFDYYSFTTISSIGYADITTTAPASNTLVWLEVICGQFYMAVVVASIVGIRLAEALSSPSDDH